MRIEFIRLARKQGPAVFMVWDREAEKFEEHNGRDRWPSWEAFLADLDAGLAEEGRGANHWFRDHAKALRKEYLSTVPPFIKNIGKDLPPLTPPKQSWLAVAFSWLFVAGFVSFLGFGIWIQIGRPILGSLGVIDYKSPATIRYETFLAGVSGCVEDKKVMTTQSSKFPALHTFSCPDGSEKVWTYKVERVSKVQDGAWILD